MGDSEHPSSLTPCLAQRNGRGAGSQDVGEKDEEVDGKAKAPIGFSDSESCGEEEACIN
jgi:hypothetical protein